MTARPSPADQMRLPLQRDLPDGAEGFVVSDCNRAAVEALAEWPNRIGGVMAICGPAGCGKSLLKVREIKFGGSGSSLNIDAGRLPFA
jgi:chromosomal replication initiation ATPase DnaA